MLQRRSPTVQCTLSMVNRKRMIPARMQALLKTNVYFSSSMVARLHSIMLQSPRAATARHIQAETTTTSTDATLRLLFLEAAHQLRLTIAPSQRRQITRTQYSQAMTAPSPSTRSPSPLLKTAHAASMQHTMAQLRQPMFPLLPPVHTVQLLQQI